MSLLSLCVVLLLAASPEMSNSANAQISDSSKANLQELVRKSSFIFVGTVKRLNASTVPIVSADEKTVTVHVDEVVYNAGVVTDIVGSEITLQLQTAGSMKENERAVFFTNVTTYGESIAVAEVGHTSTEGLEAARTQIKDTLARVPNEQLSKRIAQADLIATGTVIAVHPTAETQQHPPASEHDPQWWEATLKVQSVEKGPAQKGDVVFFFPHSDDIRWFASPKFKEGQQGVFLLHRGEDTNLRTPGFTALNPLDFQPFDQRPNVLSLIHATRR